MISDAAWAEALLVRVSEVFAQETPAGIGRWDELWEAIDGPYTDLLVEVDRLGRGTGSREKARALALEVRAATRVATAKWEAMREDAA